ncbi:MAG: Magnesium chelatase, subunit ChlI, partial [uncultured Acidimicrobiales bacterium]
DVPTRHPRPAPRLRLGVGAGEGGGPPQRGDPHPSRGAAVPRCPRVRGHRPPPARERPPRRPRHHLPGRAGPGEDPHDPEPGRPARRVAADRGRLRDQRRPVRPVLPLRPRPRGLQGRGGAGRVDPPGHPLRREAGHAGHLDRRPHRGGRPHQGGGGPLPLRRAHAPLRPRPPHQPGHLRHERAARPGGADPGGPPQRARGARRAGARLQGAPPGRRPARRLRQPRRLHEPRAYHHPAQGPLRQPDPHALPPRRRHRDGHRRPGARRLRRRRDAGGDARRAGRGGGDDLPPRSREPPRQPAVGRVGPPHRGQPRDAAGQRHPPVPPPRRDRGRPPHERPRGPRRLHDGQDRGRDDGRRPRRGRRREPREGSDAHRVQAALQHRPAGGDRRGLRRGPHRPRRGRRAVGHLRRPRGHRPRAAGARGHPDRRRREPGGGGVGGRVHPRGPPPLEAPQQGLGRGPVGLPVAL